jgi:hypothetical protein
MTDTTATPGNLVQKLIAAKKAIGVVRKNETNEQQKFKFRGIDAVINACSGPLNDQGILTYPVETVSVEQGTATTRGGAVMNTVTVVMRYAFTDGKDIIEFSAPGSAFDSGDKATAKAVSVAYRTALLQALQLPTDEPDPDSDVYDAQIRRPENPATPEQLERLDDHARRVIPRGTNFAQLMATVLGRRAERNNLTQPEAGKLLAHLDSHAPQLPTP